MRRADLYKRACVHLAGQNYEAHVDTAYQPNGAPTPRTAIMTNAPPMLIAWAVTLAAAEVANDQGNHVGEANDMVEELPQRHDAGDVHQVFYR